MNPSVRIDFLVPGFSKCGTTTLCALLDTHPEIFIPRIKEPWYFSSEDFENQHQHYQQHFAQAKGSQLKGEGSVSYSGADYEDVSVERIYANNPECKFIFIARNPRRRIESSYREMHNSGVQYGLNAPYKLNECLQAFPQMVDDSLYWQRLEKYRSRFGEESILVVFLEELKQSVASTLAQCFSHLGLHAMDRLPIDEKRLNDGESKLFDSRLLRYLRRNRYTGPRLARIGPFEQDRFLVPLGLRRPFGGRSVKWDAESIDRFNKTIVPDARKFLMFYNRPLSLWGLEE